MLLLYENGNGYYEELRKMQKEDGCEDADFGFLENEQYDAANSAYDYLHGMCIDFAVALADEFGYKIETVHDDNENLIHAYCISEYAGKRAYIDIRGITTNPILFFEEFEDWLDYADGQFLTLTGQAKVEIFDTSEDYKEKYDELSEFFEEAGYFISLQPYFYEVEKREEN